MHKKFTLVIPKSCINFTTSKYIAKKFCIKKKMYNFKNTKKMKKLVFGLVAIILLGFNGNAQDFSFNKFFESSEFPRGGREKWKFPNSISEYSGYPIAES